MANNPRDFPIFSHIDKNMIDKMAIKIVKLLGNLSAVLGINVTVNLSGENVPGKEVFPVFG